MIKSWQKHGKKTVQNFAEAVPFGAVFRACGGSRREARNELPSAQVRRELSEFRKELNRVRKRITL